jgi:hypothetical protein
LSKVFFSSSFLLWERYYEPVEAFGDQLVERTISNELSDREMEALSPNHGPTPLARKASGRYSESGRNSFREERLEALPRIIAVSASDWSDNENL